MPIDPPQDLLYGADPHIAFFDNQYWIYRTGTVQETTAILKVYVSSDRANWNVLGPLIELTDISWIEDDGELTHFLWAPAIVESNGTYFLYFSVGPQNPTPSRIGVAVSDNPAGPFVDSGAPLLTGGNGFEAIDPMVFIDPVTNTPYLYAGGSAGSTLRVFQLHDNMIALDREIIISQPENFTEGPFMHLQDGVYYLSYSNGRYNDDTYSAHYSQASSPSGPWTYCGSLVSTNSEGRGPGHNSFLQDPDDPNIWYFAYHRWDNSHTTPPYKGDRHIVVEELNLGSRSCPG